MILAIQQALMVAGVVWLGCRIYKLLAAGNEQKRTHSNLVHELNTLVEEEQDEEVVYAAEAIRDCLMKIGCNYHEYSAFNASQVINRHYIALERLGAEAAERIRQQCHTVIEFYCRE